MKIVPILLILLFLAIPAYGFADCSKNGTTVIYINGIFGKIETAQNDKNKLEYEYYSKITSKDVAFFNGFNQSHGGGAIDVVQSALQMLVGETVDYDLTNILRKAHEDLKTQKIILLGHSQGSFYTNAAYEYLVSHGVNREAIDIYNVGTPASRVAGSGKYLTSSTDKLIESVRLKAKDLNKEPLPANVTYELPEDQKNDSAGGHYFSKSYLALAADRIIKDIDSQINNLKATDNKEECFIQPERGTKYWIADWGYGLVDGMVKNHKALATSKPLEERAAMANAFFGAIRNFGQSFASSFSEVVRNNRFLGSALTSPVINNVPNNVPDNIPVIDNWLNRPEYKEAITRVILNPQNDIDNIEEMLDLIRKEIESLSKKPKLDIEEEENNLNNGEVDTPVQENNTGSYGYTSGGVEYPSILISEVQVAGLADEKQEFVELYNPNNFDVNLTGWYLQRKTATGQSWATYASNTLFNGKIVPANGYFLIARQGFYTGLADIFVSNSITDDNSFALKNPNGDMSDRLGFGNGNDPETLATQNPTIGYSIGRKILSDGSEAESNNNFIDFELQNLTPKSKNITYSNNPPTPKKVLINEIQIDSTVGAGGTDDDWVELYNPNDTDVDLSSWSIQRFSSDEPCSLLKGYYKKNFTDGAIIKAKSYFLLASTQANDTLKNLADMTVGWTLTDNNTIYLVNNDEKIESQTDENISDKVGFGLGACYPENSPALSPSEAKSIERKIIGTDTDNNSTDFRISNNPTPKASLMNVKIEDGSSYLNNVVVDNGAQGYNLLIKWSSQSQDIDHFQIQQKLNNGTWKDWLANTTKTEDNFIAYYSSLSDQNTYSFRAKAVDINQNQSDWTEINIDLSAPVVINELGLYGTGAGAKDDQWVELYNKSSQSIDLTGWKLVSDSFTATLSGTIPANGYFLLENNENAISDITANQIIGEKFATNYLKLIDKNNRFIDEVYNQSNSGYYSLERISSRAMGSESKNWHLNNGITINGKDKNGAIVNGTPGQKNSIDGLYTILPLGFGANTTLPKSFSPYAVGGVNIFSGTTLTVEAGSVFKFYYNTGMEINGTLNAIGSLTDKIIFTSINDDEYGGDTNEDGVATTGKAGQWFGLKFTNTSTGSALSNVLVRYGGNYQAGWGFAISANNSAINLTDSTIEKNKNLGMDLINSGSIIDNVKLLEQNSYNGILVRGGSPTIKNSYFYKNYYGIYLQEGYDSLSNIIKTTPTIQNNNFVENEAPIFVSDYSYPILGGNTASQNQFDAIIYSPNQIKENITFVQDLPYLIKSIITIPSGKTLTINPGVIVNFKENHSGLKIEGTLMAQGDLANIITFRPYYFDQPGIQPGTWLGISFSKTSVNSVLDNIYINYGGNYDGSPADQTFNSAIKIDRCLVSVKNSTIENNKNTGIWLANSNSIIDNVKFYGHKTSNTGLPAKAIWVEGGSPEIKNSTFQDNTNNIYQSSWTNPDTSEVIPPTPNLHDTDPLDPEKNIFL